MPRNFNTVCWAIINTLLSPKQKKETLVVWTSLNTQVLALNVCVCGGVCAWACLSSKNYYFSVYYNINHIGHTDLSRIDFTFVICWLLLRCACHETTEHELRMSLFTVMLTWTLLCCFQIRRAISILCPSTLVVICHEESFTMAISSSVISGLFVLF